MPPAVGFRGGCVRWRSRGWTGSCASGVAGVGDGCWRGDALAPIERAAGMPLGAQAGVARLSPALLGVRDALERAVLGALARQPCTVSFSGGRDSSAVLAFATYVARKHGLDEPIPLTLRFPSTPRDESRWQELVVAHLGLREWERIEVTVELDVLGDLACVGLTEHGLLWPANARAAVRLTQRGAACSPESMETGC